MSLTRKKLVTIRKMKNIVFCLFAIFFLFNVVRATSEKLYQETAETADDEKHSVRSHYVNKMLNKFDAGTNDLFTQNNLTNVNNLVKLYCSSVLSAGFLEDGGFIYDPDQSAFMYFLCTTFDNKYSVFFDSSFSGYFLNQDFNKLGLPVNKRNKELLYKYVDDLFNNIVGDYFMVKQVNVYGLQTDKETGTGKKLEDQVNEFSAGYFNGIKVCGKKDPTYSFPKSCKYATQYLRGLKKLYASLNIISIDGLHAGSGSETCSSTNKLGNTYNIMYCGLLGDPAERELNSFVNLVYNELFYYNLFVQYFTHWMESKPFLLYVGNKKDISNISREKDKLVQEMQTELYFAQEAVKVSLGILRQSFVTYPIHVGFLMYWESLQGFGKALAKIVTPIYTMYDKFRNVQDPGE